MTRIAGFAFAAAIVLGSLSAASAQPLRPAQAVPTANQANGFPAPRCSRPADQEAARIKRLADALQQARAAADRDPLLYADVGYYETELAASRRCLPAVAER